MNKLTSGFIEYAGITKPELMPKHSIWFTSCTTSNVFVLPQNNPPMMEIFSIMAVPEIQSLHIVNTPEAVSYEGQMLEGNNLIIKMILKHNIKYISETDKNKIYLTYFESPEKSINIVIPVYYVQPLTEKYTQISQLVDQGRISIHPYIEDIYSLLLDNKTLYISTALFIDVNVKK